MWLCLVLWLGGILFFSAVEAPSVFKVLGAPDTLHFAADIVGRSLSALHYIGLACGVLFILCALAVRELRGYLRTRNFVPEITLVAIMLALTMFSQFWITQGIRLIRAANPQFEQMPPDSPQRQQFDRLHRYSTYTEATVLLLGIGVVVFASRDLLRA